MSTPTLVEAKRIASLLADEVGANETYAIVLASALVAVHLDNLSHQVSRLHELLRARLP